MAGRRGHGGGHGGERPGRGPAGPGLTPPHDYSGPDVGSGASAIRLTSPSFRHGERMPMQHTADGADLSPALAWEGVPPGTKSLALLVEDPDAPDPAAPTRIFTHWIVYNLQPSLRGLPLGANRGGLAAGTRQGRNDFGRVGWNGPSPPIGEHRYTFTLFALDTTLPDMDAPDREELLAAIRGRVVASGVLEGRYARPTQPLS